MSSSYVHSTVLLIPPVQVSSTRMAFSFRRFHSIYNDYIWFNVHLVLSWKRRRRREMRRGSKSRTCIGAEHGGNIIETMWFMVIDVCSVYGSRCISRWKMNSLLLFGIPSGDSFITDRQTNWGGCVFNSCLFVQLGVALDMVIEGLRLSGLCGSRGH